MLFADIKRAFNYRWLLSIFVVCFVMWFSFYPESIKFYTEHFTSFDAYFSMYNKGGLYLASILCCTIPFSWSFLLDYKDHAYINIIYRVGIRKFSITRYTVNILAGASSIVIAEILMLLYCSFFFPYPDIPMNYLLMPEPFSITYQTNTYLYWAIYISLTFITCAAWASIGLTISLFIKNYLVVYVSPFIIYYFILYTTDPQVIGCAFFPGVGDSYKVLLCVLINISITISCFLIFMRRIAKIYV